MAAHTHPARCRTHEMVERVLLSPDLVPHILGPLEAEDGAAAAVCLQWLGGRKGCEQASFVLPPLIHNMPGPRPVERIASVRA